MLKPTIIGFSAICPSSTGERARERANRNNLKKTSSEKMATQKYALPKHPKEKHKKQLLPNTFQTTCSYQNRTRRLKSDFPDTSN